VEAERRSGTLHVTDGVQTVVLYLRDGGFQDLDDLGKFSHPHDRVFDLLGWTRGTFEFRADAPLPRPSTHAKPTTLTYLLMEHARREDEQKAAP
jgi:hypothetical protein